MPAIKYASEFVSKSIAKQSQWGDERLPGAGTGGEASITAGFVSLAPGPASRPAREPPAAMDMSAAAGALTAAPLHGPPQDRSLECNRQPQGAPQIACH